MQFCLSFASYRVMKTIPTYRKFEFSRLVYRLNWKLFSLMNKSPPRMVAYTNIKKKSPKVSDFIRFVFIKFIINVSAFYFSYTVLFVLISVLHEYFTCTVAVKMKENVLTNQQVHVVKESKKISSQAMYVL